MVAPVEALVSIPDSFSDIEAAPLLCAGSATYNALRCAGALPGDLVVVQGIGGLGHLGIGLGANQAANPKGENYESGSNP
jgi:D-arabinose 1-dehydrogenase-like Zn-dependent alcohol dehydrogenase